MHKAVVFKFLHSRPQRPRSFWSAPRIATSGLVQQHSVFEWLCKQDRLRPEPNRFVKLDSEHAQSDGKSVNRGLPLLDLAMSQRSRFLVLTKRSSASGNENEIPPVRRANARNVCFRISLRWPIHIINPVGKTTLSCNTPTDTAPRFL